MIDPLTKWHAVRRGRANRRKNDHLNANLKKFVEEMAGKERCAREDQFLPEVLIPCYNHGRFLRDALTSCPEGTPVTVINDASTDDTSSIIDDLERDHHLKVIENRTNLTQAGSLNRAIAGSSNNLFIILNADDCLLPFTLSTVLRVFEGEPRIRLLGGNCITFTRSETLRAARALPYALDYDPALRRHGPEDAVNFTKLNDINMTMSGSAFLRSAWASVGGFRSFRDRVCSVEDRDFQMRVCALFEIGVLDEPLALYRTTSSLRMAGAP